MTIPWTRERLAWVAGVLEDDGCFTSQDGAAIVTASMTDGGRRHCRACRHDNYMTKKAARQRAKENA